MQSQSLSRPTVAQAPISLAERARAYREGNVRAGQMFRQYDPFPIQLLGTADDRWHAPIGYSLNLQVPRAYRHDMTWRWRRSR